jgi:hypothetical protein
MHNSPWVDLEKDGSVYQSIMSLGEGTQPLLKCRVVKNSLKTYDVVIRDPLTGELLAAQYIGQNRKDTQEQSIWFAEKILAGKIL